MYPTELSSNLIDALTTYHLVAGISYFVINLSVCVLVIFDNDTRSKVYRKYLLTLQIFSMFVDMFCNAYGPILLVNCRLVFSESPLAMSMDIVTFFAVLVFLFGGVVTSYFACVYYRRNAILPNGSRFCFVGWRQLILFVSLQLYSCIISAMIYDIPPILNWLTSKPSYIYIAESELLTLTGLVSVILYLCIFTAIVKMIVQVLIELKHGMYHASTVTKRYQMRAVISLVFQGTVPNFVYVAPVIVECILYMNTQSMGLESAARNHMTSAASSLLFSIISAHTVAHSITVIVCSPTYRNTLLQVIRKLPSRLQLCCSSVKRKASVGNALSVIQK